MEALTTSWPTTTANTNIPSEKLVKDSLDAKQNKLPTTTTSNQVLATTTTSGTYALKTVGNGLTINTSNVLGHSNTAITAGSSVGSTTKALTINYDTYGHITGTSTANMYPPTSVGTSGQFWGTNGTTPAWTSLKTSWSSTVANTNIPSEKLVKDSLDTKVDKKGGTSGQYLKSNGTSNNSSWETGTATPTKDSGTLFTSAGAYNLQQQIGVIGEVIWYAGKTVPAHFLACQGQDVSKTTYAALYNVIGTLYGSGSSTTFKLPKIDDGRFIEGGASSYVGQTRSSQLPNIKGNITAICGGGEQGIFNSGSEAFYVSDSHSGAAENDSNSSISRYKTVNFDASRSSSIYQDGVTMVQPPAVIMLACIRYEHG